MIACDPKYLHEPSAVKLDDRCDRCFFFRKKGCHLHPPVRLPRKFAGDATAESRVRQEELIWGWPVVEFDDWCGQFKERM